MDILLFPINKKLLRRKPNKENDWSRVETVVIRVPFWYPNTPSRMHYIGRSRQSPDLVIVENWAGNIYRVHVKYVYHEAYLLEIDGC